jgi:peroxiredoxin Q/BCP
MEMIELSSFRGRKNVVLYFYPKDGTPVCTREALDFSDQESEFARCDTIVMGVSRDDCMVHEEFCDKHGISVRLLSDMDCEVSRKYEVLMEQAVNGSVREGVQRCTFVIDKKGVLRHILRDMNPREHVAEVLKIVRQLNGH